MAKYKETCDLYDDEGKLLKSNVALEKVSPLVNPAIKKMIATTKRTVAINMAGIENGVKTGAYGKGIILGRSLNLSITKDVDALAARIKELVQVTDGDDTKVTKIGGGKLLLVEAPMARMDAAATYDAASTAVAAAATQAIVDHYKVDMFNAPVVKSAIWGTYPQTMDMAGGNIVTILSIPQNNEGLGYALRNISANHVA
ncbi:MAG: methyl-coenzyme M reductase subunit beta, partial [Methanomicrobiales archaeon]|nr:methyl-coenzyme M reductase subunit beta [Methanomicrobiales archaeon]